MSSTRSCLANRCAAGPGQPLGDDLVERAKSITDPLNIMILVSLTCTMCPETKCLLPSALPPEPGRAREAYDVSHFPELKDQYGAMSVPCIVITHADGTQQVEFGKKSIPPNARTGQRVNPNRTNSNNNDSAKIVTCID